MRNSNLEFLGLEEMYPEFVTNCVGFFFDKTTPHLSAAMLPNVPPPSKFQVHLFVLRFGLFAMVSPK